MRLGRARQRRLPLEEGLELGLAEFERLRRTRDDDLVDFVVGLGQRGFQRRLDRAADERRLRPRMLEHVGQVVSGEERVHGDRHAAREDRAQERHRPVGVILHDKDHPLLALDAGILERRGEAPGPLVEAAVGQNADIVDKRRLVGTADVRIEEMPGEVEGVGRRRNRAHAHPKVSSRRRRWLRRCE